MKTNTLLIIVSIYSIGFIILGALLMSGFILILGVGLTCLIAGYLIKE